MASIQELAGSSRSDFNSAARRSAVWFSEDDRDGSVRRWASQGRTVMNLIQGRVGAPQDGAWGQRTNAALRAAARRYGADPSVFVDGRVTPRMMELALELAYAIGHDQNATSPPWMHMAVPPSAVMPRWNDAPPPDAAASGVVEEQVLQQATPPPASTPAPVSGPPAATQPPGQPPAKPDDASPHRRVAAVVVAAVAAGAVLWVAWPRRPPPPPPPAASAVDARPRSRARSR